MGDDARTDLLGLPELRRAITGWPPDQIVVVQRGLRSGENSPEFGIRLADLIAGIKPDYSEPPAPPLPAPAPPAPPAQKTERLWVKNAAGVNVRSQPGTLGNSPVGKLDWGAAIIVEKASQRVGAWTWVRIAEGEWTGKFLAKELLSATQPNPPRPPPPPPAPKPAKKIGLHLHLGTRKDQVIGMARRLHEKGKPLAACVVISDAELANDLAAYTTVVFRQVWGPSDPHPTYPTTEANALAAQVAIAAGKAWARGNHKAFNDKASKAHFLQFANEVAWHPFDWAFNLGLMQACDEMGRKAAIFADAPGGPEPEQWAQRRLALEYAKAHDHRVLLHAYGPKERPDAPVSDAASGPWYGQRYKRLYAAVPESARPKLIIGEAGTWSARFQGIEPTLADMRAYNEIVTEEWLDAVCWWTVGNGYGSWPDSPIDAALAMMEEWLAG